MGRKNINKISKYKTEEEEEEEDETEYIDDETDSLEKIYDYQFNAMWETRKAMIEYCDNTGIPLCDYLTIDMFEVFLNHLSDSQ